jgi:aconitate hydratase
MVVEKLPTIKAYAVNPKGDINEFELSIGDLTDDERKIILAGCLINFYRG